MWVQAVAGAGSLTLPELVQRRESVESRSRGNRRTSASSPSTLGRRAVECGLMDVRASDADRDATVNRLREAAAEGRLTLEELTDRIEAAASAVMCSDLVALTSDLPGTAAAGVATQPAGVRGVGDVKRSGPWTVPAENSFRTWFGHIKLDLRQAQIGATETHIHARALFGNVDLLVPEGSRSRCRPARRWAGPTCKPAPGYLGRRASCSPAGRSSATSKSATGACGRSWGAGAD
jgi:DUF1707 SHOCT-like domain